MEQVSAALLALVLASPGADEEAWRVLVARYAEATPEPEPPPGLRAPADTDRHARAAEEYARALAEWKAAEAARRERFVADCGAFLDAHPESAHRPGVLYLRGATRFRSGRHAEARADLEAFLAAAPSSPEAGAARGALVAACRALGDYRGALAHAGPDPSPDLLEEAGEIERAIAAAERAGDPAKAAGWRQIGRVFPGSEGKIPPGAEAVVVQAGVGLPAEREEALVRDFGREKVRFLGWSAEQKGLYLLDRGGVIRSVNPRFDTLHHRIAHLAARAK